MHAAVACQALQSGHCLEVRYDGYVRIVEVHACGWTKEDHAVMRVWRIRGGSVSNEPGSFSGSTRQLASSCSMSCPPLPGRATSGETELLSASSANSNPPQSPSCACRKSNPDILVVYQECAAVAADGNPARGDSATAANTLSSESPTHAPCRACASQQASS